MKTLKIYSRKILERTGYRKYPYKEVEQVVICYGKENYSNCYEKIDNPKLKIKFEIEFESRSRKEIEKYIAKLSRTSSDNFKKETINKILSYEAQ